MVHTFTMDRIKRGGSQQRPAAATSGPPRSSTERRYSFKFLVEGTTKKLTLHVKNLADGPGNTMARSCTRGLPRHQSLAILVIAALALAGMVQHTPTMTLQALSDPLNSTEFAAYVANTSYLTRHCSGEKTNHTVQRHSHHVVDNLNNSNDTGEEEEPKLKTMAPSLLDFKVPKLDEDAKISTLHAAFLWGALVSPIIGWFFTRRCGAKIVFAWGIIFAGGSSVFVPAVWGTKMHIFLRIVQGFGTGVLWAALHTLTATWCPREQLSYFVSAYSAWSLGWGLTALIGPGLIHLLGKDFLFYMQALFSISWFACWTSWVADSPASANRDKWYVAFQPQRGTTVVTVRASQPSTFVPERIAGRVPWRKLVSSGPVWACAIAMFGGQWGYDTLRIAVPKYLHLVYGFAFHEVFVISSLPHFGHFLSALTFGLIADHVISSRITSATTTRKLLVYTAHFMPAALLFVTAFTGCDPSAPAAMFCAAVLFSGALPAGVFVSALEIAPNYAGLILAICQTFGAAGGLLSNLTINEWLHGPLLPGSWRPVFSGASLMLVTTAAMFLSWGSGTEQPWNRTSGDNAQQRETNEEQNDENQVITEAAENDEDGDRGEDAPTLHPSATQMTLVSCS